MWGVWIPVSDEKHLAEIMMRTLRDRNPPMEMVVMQLNPKVPQATPCARCKYIRLDCEPLPGYTCFKQAAPPAPWKPSDNNIWPIGTRVRDKKNGKLGTIVRYSEKSGRPIAQWDDWTFMVDEGSVEAVEQQAAPPAQQPPYERCAVWLAGNCPFDSRPCDGCSWFQPREGAV